MSKSLFLGLLLASACMAQANFDLPGQAPTCTYSFPAMCGAGGDPEGVSWNGNSAASSTLWINHPTVDTLSGAGMPCSGGQFLRNPGSNTLTGGAIPAGGPIPAGWGSSDVYIPIPTGAGSVSFCWDFYSMEGPNASPYNDAGDIAIVGTCGGPALVTLVYADTWTPSLALVPAGCAFATFYGPTQVAPAGPQSVIAAAIPAGGAFLRIRAANATDNSYPSQMVIDHVAFDCALYFSSPAPGTVRMDHTPCAASAGDVYFMAYRIGPPFGTTPFGNWYGLDIGFSSLVSIFNSGFPFTGSLSGVGAASFGPVGGLPSGLTFYAVSTIWTPGFSGFVSAYPLVSYTVP